MDISTRLNRDFYIKMRINGYSHETIVSNVFPPERSEKFLKDIEGLDSVDFTKKADINKLVDGKQEVKKEKTKTKNKTKQ